MRVVTMKSKITFLTIMAVAIFAVQQRGVAQDAWQTADGGQAATPSNSDLQFPAGSESYSEHVGDLQTYSTFVGDNSSDSGELEVTDFASFAGGEGLGGSHQKGDHGLGGGKGHDFGGGCGEGCQCPMCRHNNITRRAFVSFEYLQWWDKARSIPPLVTTDAFNRPINSGPPSFTPDALTNPAAGISPTSRLLFGGGDIGGSLQAGARLTGGLWLDDDRSRAIGVKAYGNEGFSLKRNIASDGTQPLGLSFFNTEPTVMAEDAEIIAHSNFGINRNGDIAITSQNEFVGGEVFFRSLLDSDCNYRLDAVTTYQFARLNDDLLMRATINDANLGNTFTFTDLFDVSNTYNAGGLGALAEIYKGNFTLSMLGKISLGNMRQEVTIAGTNTGGLGPIGGFYTQPTNIGVYSRDVTVWSPEANFKLAYAVTCDLSISVGYTFIYWNKMALAGDQLDRNINATQLSGGGLVGASATPAFTFHDTDYWVQTLDIGVNWRY